MNNTQLEILRSELLTDPESVGYSSMNFEAIVTSLNAPGAPISNPVSQPTIAIPFGPADILGLMTRPERIAVLASDTFRALCLRLWAVGDNPYVDALMAFVATDSMVQLETATVYAVAVRLIEVSQFDLLPALAAVLEQDGKISTDTAEAMGALLSQTQLDPRWTATVPGPARRTVLGLPLVMADDVQQVL